MSLYTLYCERCQRQTTHDEGAFEGAPEGAVKEHPRFGKMVYCRDCEAGRSRADVPEDGMDVTVTAKLQVSVPVEVDPSEIEDDESIYEYVARLVRDEHLEAVREELSKEDVESAYVEREEGVWPNP